LIPLFPRQTVEELLSVAHVQAVAASAGVSIATYDKDFGIDGHFRAISVVGIRRFPNGYGLDYQLKASINCEIGEFYVKYDLESKTYNDLIRREQSQSNTPCILLLKALPAEQGNWINADQTGLFLSGPCYWMYLQGEPSSNKESVRIRIPKTNLFTPTALLRLLDAIRT
jgi:Domain of unknown function (DUF4365)